MHYEMANRIRIGSRRHGTLPQTLKSHAVAYSEPDLAESA
jgi:hypothetical protein